MMEGLSTVVKCGHCEAPAMINRMPGGKSSWHIHRLCWPCAKSFYQGPDSEITKAVLHDFLVAMEWDGKEQG